MRYELTARRLKEALSDMGMTQQELADKSGIGKSSISHYINGSNEPANKSAFEMARVLNVNPAWLMGLEVPKESISDLEEKMAKTRLDFLEISETDEEALKLNEEKFWLYHQDYKKVKEALEFMNRFDNADPDVQSAIQTLLKLHQSKS